MFLIHRGDAEKRDLKGYSPLHVAAMYGNVGILELLISHGANMFALDDFGQTAAKLAAKHQKKETCQYLDTLAVRWEVQNRNYVEKLQVKAMKELERRMKKNGDKRKDAQPRKISYEHATAPSGHGLSSRAPLTQTPERPSSGQGRKRRLTPQDALRQNFELRTSNSSESVETGGKRRDSDDMTSRSFTNLGGNSAGNTFRPLPRHNQGPLLNSLSQLPLNIHLPDEMHHTSDESGFHSRASSSTTDITKGSSGLPQLQLVASMNSVNDSPLATFLQSLDLGDCIQLLHKEKLDLEAIALCSENDLISIGLPLGPRKKILNAVQRRNKLFTTPGKMTDSEL